MGLFLTEHNLIYLRKVYAFLTSVLSGIVDKMCPAVDVDLGLIGIYGACV